jgi:hypothetical protein
MIIRLKLEQLQSWINFWVGGEMKKPQRGWVALLCRLCRGMGSGVIDLFICLDIILNI